MFLSSHLLHPHTSKHSASTAWLRGSLQESGILGSSQTAKSSPGMDEGIPTAAPKQFFPLQLTFPDCIYFGTSLPRGHLQLGQNYMQLAKSYGRWGANEQLLRPSMKGCQQTVGTFVGSHCMLWQRLMAVKAWRKVFYNTHIHKTLFSQIQYCNITN